MNKEVLEYIRANRRTYTREAIDAKLREQGYSDADIEQAWAVVHDDDKLTKEIARTRSEEERSRPPQESYSSTEIGCWYPLLYSILAIVGLILVILTNIGLSLRISGPPRETGGQLIFVNVGSIVLFIALIAVAARLRDAKRWSAGQVAGLVVAVAAVWYVIVAGTCLKG